VTQIQAETEIAAPREAVFELLLDPHRLSEWVTASRGVSEVSDDPLEQGSSFSQTLRLAGRQFDVRWNVTELERPALIVWEGRGPAGSRAEVRYELSENGDGTRFLYSNSYSLPGGPLGAVAGGAVAGAAKHAMRKTLANLKRVLESGGSN
jgi:uncharacterized protein YndB with AHSA1/START domain